MELTKYHKERYGNWAGNPKGHAPDSTRCAEEVFPNDRGGIRHQCNRKRGFGPDGAYCHQHDPEQKKRRARKSSLKHKVDSWWRYGKNCSKAKIANVAIAVLAQQATYDDLERAVADYNAELAEIEAAKAELEAQ